MAIIAPKSEKKQFEPVPAGNHVARVYSIIDIGTNEDEFKGEKKMVHKIRVGFELPNETKVFKEEKGAEPYNVSREWTLSFAPKSNLLPIVEGILGRKMEEAEAEVFDVTTLIGQTCLLNIVHEEKNGTTYANIHGTSPIPKGMECPPAVNKPVVLDYDNFDAVTFGLLPDFIKEKMVTSEEYKAKFPDGVPF